MRAVHTEVLIF